MSSHKILSQHGMTILECLSHFGTDAQCAEALKRVLWSRVFCCPKYSGNRPLEPRALEVEFFPMEEVLHEKVKIH